MWPREMLTRAKSHSIFLSFSLPSLFLVQQAASAEGVENAAPAPSLQEAFAQFRARKKVLYDNLVQRSAARRTAISFLEK
jgi:hypothetical protein